MTEQVLEICKICYVILRLVKRDPICPVCNKPLNRNGYKSIYLNKRIVEIFGDNIYSEKIKQTILFESVARQEDNNDSDIYNHIP